MNDLQRIVAIRTGGGVRRCHGIRHHGEYRVDSHSWGVAALVWQLFPEAFPRLAVHCILHDVPEAWTGDIPAPTKRYNPAVKTAIDGLELRICGRLQIPHDSSLSEEDRAILKACDLLELLLWADEQVAGGNRHAACVGREVTRYFREVPPPEPVARVLEELKTGSVEHRTDAVIMEISQ